ncbi:hypothetical protein Tco_0197741, partial [Tanacetum coccineum]
RVILYSSVDGFEKLSDDIQSFIEITDGGFHNLVSLISVSNILIIVLINGGLKVSIGDCYFFMMFLLFLNDSIEEDSGYLLEILDQLPFSGRKSVVKPFKIRTG